MRLLFLFYIICIISVSLFGQTYRENYFNGKPKIIVKQIPDSNLTIVSYYYFNGNKDLQFTLINDTLNGKYVDWYKNQQLNTVGFYRNGRKNGNWIYYYKNGQTKIQGFYVNDIPDDWWISYYSNGKLKEKAYYINGLLHGKWVCWYKNGKVEEEGVCKNGKKHKLWVEYYPNGKKKRITYYNEGVPVYEPVFWWSTGRLDLHSRIFLESIYEKDKKNRTEAEQAILKAAVRYVD
ncbi:MAG: hypothetical protein Kow0068_21600 [Marinilabiliales bacterium]